MQYRPIYWRRDRNHQHISQSFGLSLSSSRYPQEWGEQQPSIAAFNFPQWIFLSLTGHCRLGTKRSLKEGGDQQQIVNTQIMSPHLVPGQLSAQKRAQSHSGDNSSSSGTFQSQAGARWQHKQMTARATGLGLWQQKGSSGTGEGMDTTYLEFWAHCVPPALSTWTEFGLWWQKSHPHRNEVIYQIHQ